MRRLNVALGALLALGAGVASTIPAHAAEDYDQAMKRAGAAAILEHLPAEVLEAHGVPAEELAGDVIAAVSGLGWQPIDSAPRDAQILLGLSRDGRFDVALGEWKVLDEQVVEGDMGAGTWSPTLWWGVEPTHWAPIPEAPGE